MSNKGSEKPKAETLVKGQTGNQTSQNVKVAQDKYRALMNELKNEQAQKDKK